MQDWYWQRQSANCPMHLNIHCRHRRHHHNSIPCATFSIDPSSFVPRFSRNTPPIPSRTAMNIRPEGANQIWSRTPSKKETRERFSSWNHYKEQQMTPFSHSVVRSTRENNYTCTLFRIVQLMRSASIQNSLASRCASRVISRHSSSSYQSMTKVCMRPAIHILGQRGQAAAPLICVLVHHIMGTHITNRILAIPTKELQQIWVILRIQISDVMETHVRNPYKKSKRWFGSLLQEFLNDLFILLQ